MMLAYALAGSWLLWLWVQDTVAARSDEAHPRALPGARPASLRAIVVAVLGALLLVALETGGELALGIAEEQDTIAATFLLAMLAAAVIEELVFRGYCVVRGRGRMALWLSVLGFSCIFALLHPYLWDFQMPDSGWAFWQGEWTWKLNSKGVFSTALVFANSLWFYACRFMRLNPEHSLLPCFAAHAASNLAVFAVKAVQGFVAW